MPANPKIPLTFPPPTGTLLTYDFTDDSEAGIGA